jgi:hypothetical protein
MEGLICYVVYFIKECRLLTIRLFWIFTDYVVDFHSFSLLLISLQYDRREYFRKLETVPKNILVLNGRNGWLIISSLRQ